MWCERVFAPWGDMEEAMREHAIPLYALESHDPVRRRLILIAFTIGYEMSYTNILNMLDLSGVPLLAQRAEGIGKHRFCRRRVRGEPGAAGGFH